MPWLNCLPSPDLRLTWVGGWSSSSLCHLHGEKEREPTTREDHRAYSHHTVYTHCNTHIHVQTHTQKFLLSITCQLHAVCDTSGDVVNLLHGVEGVHVTMVGL